MFHFVGFTPKRDVAFAGLGVLSIVLVGKGVPDGLRQFPPLHKPDLPLHQFMAREEIPSGNIGEIRNQLDSFFE